MRAREACARLAMRRAPPYVNDPWPLAAALAAKGNEFPARVAVREEVTAPTARVPVREALSKAAREEVPGPTAQVAVKEALPTGLR